MDVDEPDEMDRMEARMVSVKGGSARLGGAVHLMDAGADCALPVFCLRTPPQEQQEARRRGAREGGRSNERTYSSPAPDASALGADGDGDAAASSRRRRVLKESDEEE